MNKFSAFLALFIAFYTAPSFSALPGPINKTGIFKSKCNLIEIFKVTEGDSNSQPTIHFNLEISDCKSSLGSIKNGVASLGCSSEGCDYNFEKEKCKIQIVSRGNFLKIFNYSYEEPGCGFSANAKVDGDYKKK
jgi:hypothetical protein